MKLLMVITLVSHWYINFRVAPADKIPIEATKPNVIVVGVRLAGLLLLSPLMTFGFKVDPLFCETCISKKPFFLKSFFYRFWNKSCSYIRFQIPLLFVLCSAFLFYLLSAR
ncbi:hypothetical protein NE237_031265 [Protea cynaroides]|uniref:Uncharacterized protein n=1 Tax=Protea cynaroides TaxID=273540 RepID=A0A9Q0R1Z8_9MAGN|nr:hypothetical protein NE237_031265 [Protea cynaroides]